MDTSEVAYVAVPVQLFCDNGKTRCLLQIKTRLRSNVPRRQKIQYTSTDVKIHFLQYSLDIAIFSRSLIEGYGLPIVRTVMEIHRRQAIAYVVRDQLPHIVQGFLQTLLHNHPVQRSGQQNLLMLRRIRIVYSA